MRSGKMVATRRGTRVASPPRKTEDTVTEDTPTVRRTRSRTIIVTDQAQTCDSKQDETVEKNTAPAEPASPPKRQTRRTKACPTDTNQPDSTHEADVSESESCCSVVSDIQTQKTPKGKRRTVVRPRPAAAAEQEASESESCSVTSASKPRRSTRSQKKPAGLQAESATSHDNDHSEAESCSSVASLSKVLETRRITRSCRKTVSAEVSEAESCSSAVSGAQLSTIRRSTRSRTKPTEPIPINLEESEPAEASDSATPTRRSTRARKGKVKPAKEDQDYDSEGCQSGPSTSPQRKAGLIRLHSDSESGANTYTSLDSHCSVRVTRIPCTSPTGKVKVIHDSSASEIKPLDVEDKPEEEQKEALMDTTLQSVSAAVSEQEDEEEMEEEANTTLINADVQECCEDIKGNLTLTLDEDQDDVSNADDAKKIVESESRQEVSLIKGVTVSENVEENCSTEEQPETEKTEKGVRMMEECEKIPQPAMGNNEAEFVQEDQESAALKPETSVAVTEKEPAEPEKSVKLFDESEERVETVEEKIDLVADEYAVIEEQKPSELKKVSVTEEADDDKAAEVPDQKSSADQTITVTFRDPTDQQVEDEIMEVEQQLDLDSGCHESDLQNNVEDDDQPCSSKDQVLKSSQQTKPVKIASGLLDSSEDEESDDEGLSDEDAENEENDDELICSDDQPGSSGKPDPVNNNSLFVIDSRPGLDEKYYLDTTRQEADVNTDDSKAAEDEDDFVDEEDEDDEDSKVLFTAKKPATTGLSSAIDPGIKVKELGGLYISFDGSKPKSISNNLKRLKDQKNQEALLKKSVIVADFEKKDAVPPYKESQQAAKLKRKEERAKTTGDGWFNMRAPELTPELKNDLKALQMRSAMDPKRFYKKNDRDGFPKYFQVGTVVDNPADFYHSRIPKKQRKRTIVEELLADAEFRSFNKRKYQEIMTETAAGRTNKKKHSFHKKKHSLHKKK